MSDDILWQAAETLIPHRRAMRFIDQVTSNDRGLIARAHIRADNPLLTDSGLPAHAGIEYMAQALAGQKGLRNTKDIRNGVIVGISNVEITRPYFTQEAELFVYVDAIDQEGGYQVATCRVIQGEEIISAEISVMEKNNVS
jgi:predicted hotdog family 3-hydroxylacyl-ACP dehydratase